tara:strand:- start:1913 stop:2347 length:435 start_codon:yes stop_codon:yes gene_type:complete
MSLTGILGKYISEIPAGTVGLSAVPVSRYERIFKVHTQAPANPLGNNKQFYFYNILNKLDFPVNIAPNLLSSYTVPAKQPFTAISYKLYKDIDSWWILWYLNKEKLARKFYVDGGVTLNFIIPDQRQLLYNKIGNMTINDNQHF